MSQKISVTLPKGYEARVTIGRAHAYGVPVYSIAFNDEADIVAETDYTTYFDYCEHEITRMEVYKMFPNLDEEFFEFCECDFEDDEEVA